ncbi:ankyrin repeat domain-containing protein 33B isoform X2 [Oxyura jamaicensis]|uniref:ankyrin repeat domain-containing protein 33B isoform X2 n=1 Tax=Oxyura jamaicensis TaxID=8884 RepID=UPI0015A6F6FE|nr:ankyrin repeat domain-containing protein 33B isoform X2 [Oxyura jamaicensis]
MVLLSGAGGQLAGERVCPAPGSGKELPEAESGPEQGAEGAAGQGQGDEEEEEEEEEDCEEYEDFSELPDTCSIASDDSFYPPRGLEDEAEEGWSLEQGDGDSPEALSLFRACCTNNAVVLRALIRQGPEEEENGLIVACYQGYVDIVIALSQCPHLDVNWQDNEGNTALITAAQAGHITITNYLLNYFPGLDIEKRNVFGFTALMKSAMQGRTECVKALMLAGANVHSTDPSRGLTSWEWACYTGRSESAFIMQKLMDRPCPEQLCDQYKPEWPKMKELLAKAAEPKTCLQRISECMRSAVSFRVFHGPEEDGVLDHMVKVTTSLGSPFIALSCRTVCPGSPPAVGKRRLAVQEILRKQRAEEIRSLDKDHVSSYEKLFQNSKITLIPKKKDRRASLQPVSLAVSQMNTIATRKTSLLPLHLLRRSSVRPGFVIPKVRISKAPPPTFQPENARRRSSAKDDPYLQIPKWRYKELKEERKKAEEQEKKRAEEAQKQRQVSPARSRT